MRTSLNEIKEIEDYLLKTSPVDERLVFDAQMILNPELKTNLTLQRQSYLMINLYGKKQLKTELEKVHRKLFSEKKHQGFRKKIIGFFTK